MIKSMTGFASLTTALDTASIGVTIRSLNHRYLDFQIRLPQSLLDLESRIRTRLQEQIVRGRIEVAITVQVRQPRPVDIELNEQAIQALMTALSKAREYGLALGPLAVGDLLRFPQALTVKEREEVAGSPELANLGRAVEETVAQAASALEVMRQREGEQLRVDLDRRYRTIDGLVGSLAEASDAGRVHLQERLKERVSELASDLATDAAVLAQEIVRFAARSDVSEEMVRFRSHLGQWTALVGGSEACGRKLDFLLQEMNREVNTIGAKADGPGVPELIVAMKAELEKMREQVQNVE
jgi:uncharacterized protein (TIGR00255 family)